MNIWLKSRDKDSWRTSFFKFTFNSVINNYEIIDYFFIIIIVVD